MKRTIEELEANSEETFVDAVSEFYDSCIRTGHFDMEDNARFFCRENDLDESEYPKVLSAMKILEADEPEIDEGEKLEN